MRYNLIPLKRGLQVFYSSLYITSIRLRYIYNSSAHIFFSYSLQDDNQKERTHSYWEHSNLYTQIWISVFNWPKFIEDQQNIADDRECSAAKKRQESKFHFLFLTYSKFTTVDKKAWQKKSLFRNLSSIHYKDEQCWSQAVHTYLPSFARNVQI